MELHALTHRLLYEGNSVIVVKRDRIRGLYLTSATKNLIVFVKFTHSFLHLKTVFCLDYMEE